MLLPIATGTDNTTLRTKSVPVTTWDKKLKKLVEDMQDTMVNGETVGIGIAAPQVGVCVRAVIVDIGRLDRVGEWVSRPIVMINPRILEVSEHMRESEEGCLSLPKCAAVVLRHEMVVVAYQDMHKREHILEMTGLPACVVQHEVDHLEGMLFVDRLSDAERKKLGM